MTLGVKKILLTAVAHHDHQHAVGVTVILLGDLYQDLSHLVLGLVLVHFDLEAPLLKDLLEPLAVNLRANPGFSLLEDDRQASSGMSHVILPGFLPNASRSHGGCAAWVRNDLSPELVVSRSNAWVETLIFKMKILNTVVVLQYRPPDCSVDKFEDALKACKEAIEEVTNGDSRIRNILDFGDYNFPCIKWPARKVYVHENTERNNRAGEKKQAEMFLNFQDEYFMDNVIETATRGVNILDLISTNNADLIMCYKVTVNKKLSDHNTIEIRLNLTFNKEEKEEKVKNPYTTKIFEFDTAKASEEQFKRFEHLIDQFDEDKLDDKSSEEQLDIIIKVMEEAVEMTIPRKKLFEEVDDEANKVKTSNNFIPKEVRNLMRRKNKLSNKVLSSKNWYKNYQVYLELEKVEEIVGIIHFEFFLWLTCN